MSLQSSSPAPDGNASEAPWVVLRLSSQLYGLPAANISEMVVLPQATGIPGAPPYVRGMITLRGRVIPVIDLRSRLGLPRLSEEKRDMIAMLRQRAEDHRAWLDELEISVKERREFTGALDHRQCAFGQWYERYETEDLLLRSLLKRFREPHMRVHAIAGRVRELEHEQAYEEAVRLIEETRAGDLNTMLRLFDNAISLIDEQEREIAVVLEQERRLLAVTVDAVESVDRLRSTEDADMPVLNESQEASLLGAFGKAGRDDALVMLLDVARVFNDPAAAALRGAQMAQVS